jgi:hypothetical protein
MAEDDGMTGGSHGSSWNESSSESKSNSLSEPIKAGEQASYFRRLDRLTGGYKQRVRNPDGTVSKSYQPGRLFEFARGGTQATNSAEVADPEQYFSTDLSYKPMSRDVTYRPVSADLSYAPRSADLTYKSVSDAQIKELGGLGATRELQNRQARQQAIDEITADPSLTLAARQRSTQLSDRDYADRQDAIAQEVEAQITQAALEQAARDQAGRVDQAGFDAEQWAQELAARQFGAEFDAGQAAQEQAGRQAQAGFDAEEWAREFAGRQAQAGQSQALADFLQTEVGRRFEAEAKNAGLAREDMLALAQIFFAGKGQRSTSESSSKSSSLGLQAQSQASVGTS